MTEEEYLSGMKWASKGFSAEDTYKRITRDILDVLESVTLKYDDGKVEQVNIFKVSPSYLHMFIGTLSQKTNNKRMSWSDDRGKSHVFHYEYPAGSRTEFPWGPGIGVEVMTLRFKNETDFNQMTIAIQHAGRLLSPEVKDSTFKLQR